MTAPDATAATAAHLPNPPDILLGRERELAAIAALFADPACRLVTLHGPGGVGKTRLAIAAAAVDPNAWFVDLAPLAEPGAILPAVAAALGVSPDLAPDPLADLPAIWNGRLLDGAPAPWAGAPILLLVDNAEHLLPGIGALGALLHALPAARAIVTCRAVTGLPRECHLEIPPLAAPPEGVSIDAASAAEWDAVRLFARRAAAGGGFRLTDANAADVAAICRRLDGLPLAIELAAARTPALPPAAILARLDQALPLLADGPADLPTRQRTVRSTIAWGHDLLAPEEQALLRRVAVCAGGFTPEFAAALAEGSGIDAPTALDNLARHHFLQRSHDPETGTRLQMLATIREFALDDLAASGEEPEARARHAAAITAFASVAVPALRGPDRARWVARLDREHDNARAAFAWAIADQPDAALSLAAAFWRYWHERGHWAEGLAIIELALATEAAADPAPARAAARAAALNGAAVLAYLQLDLERAWVHAEAARESAIALSDEHAIAETLHTAGILHWESGNDEAALAAYEDALRRLRRLGRASEIANAVNNLALLFGRRGDLARSIALFEQALRDARETGDQRAEIDMLCNLSSMIEQQGDPARALALLERASGLATLLGGDDEISQCSLHLGIVHEHLGELAAARRALTAALDRFATLPPSAFPAYAHLALARVDARANRAALANANLRAGIAAAAAMRDRDAMIEAVDTASLLAMPEDPERAALLAGIAAAARVRERIPAHPGIAVRLHRHHPALRAALGDDRYAELRAAGSVLSLQAGIAIAAAPPAPATARTSGASPRA